MMKMEKTLKSKGLTGSHLKWIAIITMTIDHIGAFLLEPYLLNSLASAEMNTVNIILRLIGRISFPIFAFLLVEGFVHTSNFKKYLLQMGLFALVSEIPFDLARNSVLVDFTYQNIFFTLYIGLLTVTLFDGYKKGKHIKWTIPILGMALATFLKTDYSAVGVLIIFVFYYFRGDKTLRNIVVSPLLFLQLTAVFALLPIQLYKGERGRQNKLFFYLFYPLHLIVLFIIRTWLLN